ncbi:MAG: hypothetical protein AAGJ96_06090, partial [Pseudomonadota bacterium]
RDLDPPTLATYAAGLEALRAGDFHAAQAAFETATPEDPVAARMARYVSEHAGAVNEAWPGHFVLDKK